MKPPLCPFCGRDYEMHPGQLCPVIDNALTRMIAGAAVLIEDQRSERARTLGLNRPLTPRRASLGDGEAQLLVGYDLNRGCALVYNDDAADVWLGSDRQHIEDETTRFPLKANTALVFTSPAELWGIGSAAGPQQVYVMELPPGRAPVELASLATLL